MRLSNFSLIFCFLSLILPWHFPGPIGQVDAKPMSPMFNYFGKYLSRDHAPSRNLLQMASIEDSEAFSDESSVESVRDEDWKTYYNFVKSKDFHHHENSDFRVLIAHVHQIGPVFIEHHTKHDQETLDVVRIIRQILETSVLKETHKLWALGVLSYLKKWISTEKDSSLVKEWKIEDLISRHMGDFELFLLKDHDLAGAVQEILPIESTPQKLSDHVIKEVLNRASIVNSIKKAMTLGDRHRNPGFEKCLVSFMNLKTPIDDSRAKRLMKKMETMLDRTKSFFSTPPEEIFIIRMTLHMEEHHFNSMIEFKELINDPKICTRILRKDLEFQLQDPDLSRILRKVLESLMNDEILKSKSIHMALEAMTDKRHSMLHRARLTRVLNLMAKHDDEVYGLVNKELNHPHSITNLSSMFLELSHGRMYPDKIQKNDLQYLVFQKEHKIFMEKRLATLEENLLTMKFLELDVIFEVLKEFSANPKGPRTAGLTPIIKQLLIKLLSYRSNITDPNLHKIKLDAIEYILHLILLEKDDMRLNRNLSIRGTPFVQDISPEVLSVAGSDPMSLDDKLRMFSKHLTTSLDNGLILTFSNFIPRTLLSSPESTCQTQSDRSPSFTKMVA
ncbi:uncharacterized protein MELLADRAFT_109272 [Melampsora larici-populina 98AG31]|uniref:Secreted protein n=1 Tax=Melampsora larici-populina (strain 98AG31 / pathotype 3-4-7) TaxID=747676 RepID=F4RVY1_MELLP|nr:uncharacterized protein MELLADRAFT_109272 [Melampsora larici-populina 98AG31]EGG03505.1 hypothetical protein MELLADRAFT_109272 [Melampsora larici-populina 98AG31]